METSEVYNEPFTNKCSFCFKSTRFNPNSQLNIVETPGMIKEVYDNCTRYINKVYLNEDEFLSWCQPKPLPFCGLCLQWVLKLTTLNTELNQIQSKIELLVNSFTTEFLRLRENQITCLNFDIKDSLVNSIYSEKDVFKSISPESDELLELKQECEDIEELFEEHVPAELSTFIEESNDEDIIDDPLVGIKHETIQSIQTNHGKIKQNKKLRTKKAIRNQKNKKDVSVSLMRLKYDLNGDPIPERDSLPRRKAAMKAQETISFPIDDDLDSLSDGETSDSQRLEESHVYESSEGEKSDFSPKPTEKKIVRTPFRRNQSANDDRPFKCRKCDRTYKKKQYLLDHELTHDDNQRFKCPICPDVSYAYSRNLRQHLAKHKANPNLNSISTNEPPVERRYKCQQCDKSYKLKYHLKEHQRTHDNERYDCSVCNMSYAYIKNLRHHLLTAHSLHLTSRKKKIIVTNKIPVKRVREVVEKKSTNVACTICGETFDTNNKLYYHRSIVHAVTPRSCNVCKEVFDNRELLKRHKNKFHLYKLTHKCSICNKEFRSSTGLKEHLKRHNRDPNYKRADKCKCSLCGEIIPTRSELYFHMKTHNEVKPFECPLKCGKRFTTKTKMNEHVIWHKGEKSYLCEECGRGFFSKSKLTIHMRIHTGMLHYCEFCGKGFQTATHLKQHHRSHKKDFTDIMVEVKDIPENHLQFNQSQNFEITQQ